MLLESYQQDFSKILFPFYIQAAVLVSAYCISMLDA